MPLPKLIGVPTIALLLEALDKERESHGPTILGLSQFERSDHNLRHTMDRQHETPTIVWRPMIKEAVEWSGTKPSCLGEFATFSKIAA